MTDRIEGVYVGFEEDVRDDAAENIINAILMIRGVEEVEISLTGSDDEPDESEERDQKQAVEPFSRSQEKG